ncbi:hypothetical protein BV898_10921 [Hypsibius exemplaris]|uniref:Uncharacterized protein n=1 Tax=Hypsibius exemplaris TaxID=2072580 RepID=A0A1W0WI85_HYPEX|nr:hypothetical protein BV898_10921 [Hypsibius exemplaris]
MVDPKIRQVGPWPVAMHYSTNAESFAAVNAQASESTVEDPRNCNRNSKKQRDDVGVVGASVAEQDKLIDTLQLMEFDLFQEMRLLVPNHCADYDTMPAPVEFHYWIQVVMRLRKR